MEMYGQGRYTIALKKETKEMYSLTLTRLFYIFSFPKSKLDLHLISSWKNSRHFLLFTLFSHFYSLNSSDVYLNIKKVFQYLL